MKSSKFILEKIESEAAVKINYKSDFDGKPHFIRGALIGENEGSFFIEGAKFGDIVAIPKNMLISMIFPKSKDEKPKPAIIPDPVTKPYSKKEEFSYENYWKNANVQEVGE